MILDRGWWKTPDGRLVPDGHVDAAVLAYPKGSEIPDTTAARLGITLLGAGPGGKAGSRPADKSMPPPTNKGAAP